MSEIYDPYGDPDVTRQDHEAEPGTDPELDVDDDDETGLPPVIEDDQDDGGDDG
jgi:hypothetical protein